METHNLSRRTVLSAAAVGTAGLAVGGLTASVPRQTRGGADSAARAARPRRPRPVSMAMHIHGPFSEGIASFEAHLDQARRTGVQVIWWTDHDFRVAAHDHRKTVHFDGPSEPENTLSWTWKELVEGTLAAKSVEFIDAPAPAADAPTALRLAATGGAPDGGILWYLGTAWNYTYSTCVADTTLELDIRPEQLPPGACVLLQMELSYHPARAGLPAGQYVLRYLIGGFAERRHVTNGLLGMVEIPAEPGQWNRLTLDLVADVQALWPGLVAVDNSLRNLRVGVCAPADTPASAVLDRLLFHRARRNGQAAEELRREVLEHYRDEYRDVAHYRSYEVSLVRHLNWYGGDQTLPAFPSPPLRDNDPALTESMVGFLHSHGGIVCWNHPLDVESRESLVALMLERGTLGTELVEIGRDPLPELLWVLDVAARNAIFFTAVGASDDHGGKDWLKAEEPWVTYAWSASTRAEDLIEALRRGSAWFTDPAVYRGTLDIRLTGHPVLAEVSAMGAVLTTRAAVVPIDLAATDLPADATVEVVTGVVDRAGAADPNPAVTVRSLPPTVFANGPFRLPVAPESGRYVRTQVRAADGTVVAVSNPLWLLPQLPPTPLSTARRLDGDDY